MPGARQDLGQHHLARRLLGDPGIAGDDIEERRAGEPNGFQHIGKSISRHFGARPSAFCCTWAIADAASSIADA